MKTAKSICVPITDELISRFSKFVRPEGNCMLWTGCTYPTGYGCFSIHIQPYGTAKYRAHRFSYYLATGHMLNDHEVVMHTCDNPRCVRPSHLVVGTQSDNIFDAVKKGRVTNAHSITHGKYIGRVHRRED